MSQMTGPNLFNDSAQCFLWKPWRQVSSLIWIRPMIPVVTQYWSPKRISGNYFLKLSWGSKYILRPSQTGKQQKIRLKSWKDKTVTVARLCHVLNCQETAHVVLDPPHPSKSYYIYGTLLNPHESEVTEQKGLYTKSRIQSIRQLSWASSYILIRSL